MQFMQGWVYVFCNDINFVHSLSTYCMYNMLYSWNLDDWSIASVTSSGCYFSQALSAQQYYHIFVSLGVTPSTSTHNTATTLEITAAVTSIIAFVVGALAGVLVYHCIRKHQSRLTTVLSSHHQQKADLEYDYVTSGVGNKRREIAGYDTVQRIELKANVAYKPAEHWFPNLSPAIHPQTHTYTHTYTHAYTSSFQLCLHFYRRLFFIAACTSQYQWLFSSPSTTNYNR